VGGPVEWDGNEEAYYSENLSFDMEMTASAQLLFYQLSPAELALTLDMDVAEIVVDFPFVIGVTGSFGFRVVHRQGLSLVNCIRTGARLDIKNSLELPVDVAFRLINLLAETLHVTVALPLDLRALVKVAKTLRLTNTLREPGATYGDFYFDKEHA
jgi:hypothetical protein